MESIKRLIFNPFSSFSLYIFLIFFLYVLRLSDLYVFDLRFLKFLSLVVLFSFVCGFVFSKFFYNFKNFVENYYFSLKSNKIEKLNTHIIAFSIFFIGFVGSIWQYSLIGATIFQENKINRPSLYATGLPHYLGYLRVFLSYYIPLGYFLLRKTANNKFKFLHFGMILLSVTLLGLDLNRGDYLFPLIAIIFIEVFYDFLNNKYLYAIFKFILIISVFLFIFNFFGYLRTKVVMEKHYKTDIVNFYKIKGPKVIKNSTFAWVYIYATSPLENFRDMLYNQEVKQHTYGLLLLYPFAQIIFKLSGSNLKVFSEQLVPYLNKNYGLSVSSFMKDAYIDFGIIGIFIYIFAYYLLIFIGLKIYINTKNIYSLLGFCMVYNILLWSVFVNSFAIGTFLIGMFIFWFLSILDNKNYI
jgi:hypothetical protein